MYRNVSRLEEKINMIQHFCCNYMKIQRVCHRLDHDSHI